MCERNAYVPCFHDIFKEEFHRRSAQALRSCGRRNVCVLLKTGSSVRSVEGVGPLPGAPIVFSGGAVHSVTGIAM